MSTRGSTTSISTSRTVVASSTTSTTSIDIGWTQWWNKKNCYMLYFYYIMTEKNILVTLWRKNFLVTLWQNNFFWIHYDKKKNFDYIMMGKKIWLHNDGKIFFFTSKKFCFLFQMAWNGFLIDFSTKIFGRKTLPGHCRESGPWKFGYCILSGPGYGISVRVIVYNWCYEAIETNEFDLISIIICQSGCQRKEVINMNILWSS